MKTIWRSLFLTGVLTVGSLGLGATPARAQGYGFGVTAPGFSLGVGGGGYYPGYARPYPVMPPPVVVAPAPYVAPVPFIAPRPVIVPGPYYGGYYGGYRHHGGYGPYYRHW